MRRLFSTLLFVSAFLLISALRVSAPSLESGFDTPQVATSPYRTERYTLDMGVHTGDGLTTRLAFRTTVQIPAAMWLRVLFEDYQLGEASFITLVSAQDGSRQQLDAVSLRQWHGRSAFFNGGRVDVELHVAPYDAGVFVRLKEIWVGESALPQPAEPQDICGATDDRVRTTDKAIGRFVFDPGLNQIAACTGWMTANSTILTAGHCADFGAYTQPDMIEFNVPLSNAAGDPQFANADDQYPIDQTHFDFHNNGLGDDWGVFEALENSNTHLLPVHAQQAFYRLALAGDVHPVTVRVSGYGIDTTPNESNRVLQTHSGSYLGETMAGNTGYVSYSVDTEGGNSGSPIISRTNTVSVTVGIHTNGGCTSGGSNSGTTFAHTALATAIRTFYYPVVDYVDKAHPTNTVDGDIFRPWNTVDLGVFFANSGSVLSIVTGSYNEAITITKAVTLTAPVGVVTIGQ